jgi:hypothetical protein
MADVGDGRILVRFGVVGDAGPWDALLIESEAPGGGDASGDRAAVARFALRMRVAMHPVGCACCAPRGPVAEALGRLFLARARGEVPWFRSVVAVTRGAAGAEAVRAALAGDVVTLARFRLDA